MIDYTGLTSKEVKELQEIYGKNQIKHNKRGSVLKKICSIFVEPIYFLLLSAAIIYFLLGEAVDGLIMIAFVALVICVDLIQDIRTANTLKKLRELTNPKITVIRDSKECHIPAEELVPGDIMLIHEGVKLPADGFLLDVSGLCIDESILTGESEGVWKEASTTGGFQGEGGYFRKDYCYAGTQVLLGNGRVLIDKIGNHTQLGKIVDEINNTSIENTPLQKQMKSFAKQCTIFAAVFFLLVFTATFLNLKNAPSPNRIIESFLAGVVLALSMVPGELPVIQSVFLSMGALRLVKKQALIRRLPSVEALGAISVLCMDKTGTITKNDMVVSEFWMYQNQNMKLCKALSLACKHNSYDPMEIAMLSYCESLCLECSKKESLEACGIATSQPVFLKEYAFTNELKAMARVYHMEEKYFVTAKGSPETILSLCELPRQQEEIIHNKIKELSKKGLRVIAVAEFTTTDIKELPQDLSHCQLSLCGIVGLEDPIRENTKENISACYRAGIRILMITGDHPETAAAIAKKVGIQHSEFVISGNEIDQMSDEELKKAISTCNIFARVLPLHKMRIVKALKEAGEVVAMIGDGVNDSPALKIADVGIAMGKHGSQVCREASDLILLDDNISTILEAIHDGRRIYQNICKTLGYIIAIHLPIALISFFAPLLSIDAKNLLLLPLHIILIELVMNPICSVVLERQPADNQIMFEKPRNPNAKLLSKGLMLKSTLQGLILFITVFLWYYLLLEVTSNGEIARTAGFFVLVLSNINLILVNCSDKESIVRSWNKIRKDKGILLVNLLTITITTLLIYTPIHSFFAFSPLPLKILIISILLSFLSVGWYEIVKLFQRKIDKNIKKQS